MSTGVNISSQRLGETLQFGVGLPVRVGPVQCHVWPGNDTWLAWLVSSFDYAHTRAWQTCTTEPPKWNTIPSVIPLSFHVIHLEVNSVHHIILIKQRYGSGVFTRIVVCPCAPCNWLATNSGCIPTALRSQMGWGSSMSATLVRIKGFRKRMNGYS